jgi:hypothetical protein
MSGGWRGWGCKLQAPQEETTGAFYDTSTLMEVGWSWLSFLFALILHASQATITCPDDQDVIQSFDEVISSSGCPSLALESPAKIAASDFTICCDQQKICYQTCSLTKNYCDEDFKFCLHQLCETIQGVEPSHHCEQLSHYLLSSITSSNLNEYEDYQTTYCQCSNRSLVRSSYQQFFQQFYRTYASPERAIKGLMAIDRELKRSDQLTTYSKIFYELHKKYESAITLIDQRRECISYPRLGEPWSSQASE